MQMHTGADLGDIMAAAVEAEIDWKEVLCRKLIHPFDVQRLTGAGFDERAGNVVAVGPEACGRQIAVDSRVNFAHGDAEVSGGVGANDCGEW